MIKLLLQTATLSVMFLSPAFCMDDRGACGSDETTYPKRKKGTYYIALKEEDVGKTAFDQGLSHLEKADKQHKTYRKYENKEQSLNLKSFFYKISGFAEEKRTRSGCKKDLP